MGNYSLQFDAKNNNNPPLKEIAAHDFLARAICLMGQLKSYLEWNVIVG